MAKSKKKAVSKKKTAAQAKARVVAAQKRTAKHRTPSKGEKRAPAKVRAHAVKPAKPAKLVVEPKVIKLKLPAAQRKQYESLLIQLRDHLLDGINFLAANNLHNSQRESSGDISSYGTHMADAGTDNFDREFALSLVSNEQEALYEVTEALKRLENSAYGVCEICLKPIHRQRLKVLPFARFCVRCQETAEKDKRRPAQPVTAFSQFDDAEDGESEGEGEKE